MKRILILCSLLLLLFTQSAFAFMAAYSIDWYNLLTGSGGPTISSDHYQVDVTIGQTVTGSSSSSNYNLVLGYWAGAARSGISYLPFLMKSSP